MEVTIDIGDARIRAETVELVALTESGSHGGDPRQWAHDQCVWTRDIHVEVWDRYPSRSTVRDVVLPAFRAAEEAIRTVPPSTEHATNEYADNVSMRIESLQEYVAGAVLPSFPPDDRSPAQRHS